MLAYLSVLFLCYLGGFFLEENVRKEFKKKKKATNQNKVYVVMIIQAFHFMCYKDLSDGQ